MREARAGRPLSAVLGRAVRSGQPRDHPRGAADPRRRRKCRTGSSNWRCAAAVRTTSPWWWPTSSTTTTARPSRSWPVRCPATTTRPRRPTPRRAARRRSIHAATPAKRVVPQPEEPVRRAAVAAPDDHRARCCWSLVVLAGLAIGREIIRSNYYVSRARRHGVDHARRARARFSAYALQEPYLLGCLNARDELSAHQRRADPRNWLPAARGQRPAPVRARAGDGRACPPARWTTPSARSTSWPQLRCCRSARRAPAATTHARRLRRRDRPPRPPTPAGRAVRNAHRAEAPAPETPTTVTAPAPPPVRHRHPPPTPSPTVTALPPPPPEPGTNCRAVS